MDNAYVHQHGPHSTYGLLRQHFVPSTAYKQGVDDQFKSPNGGEGHRPTDEASLDIQYMMATAPGASTEYWYYQTNDLCSSFKDFLEDVLLKASNTTTVVPSVFSISYGIQGNVTGLGCNPKQILATDADFTKVAALGISIIIASGDSGAMVDVGDCWGGPLRNNTSLQGTTSAEHQLIDSYLTCCELAGSNPWTFVGPEFGTGSGVCKVFSKVTGSSPDTGSGTVSSGENPSPKVWPSYPSSSPWVTSTGSTRLIEINATAGTQNLKGGEMASVTFGSGGGFSFDFPVPSWQKESILQYFTESSSQDFEKYMPPMGTYPATGIFHGVLHGSGRGNPDISALGENFVISDGYGLFNVSGTSGVAPFFAGLITRLNIARGGKPLGFLNPWLYSNPDMFTDVVNGTNAIGRHGAVLPYGWNASTGWDPATGLGTPLFHKMLNASSL